MKNIKSLYDRQTLVAVVVFGFAMVGFAEVINNGTFTVKVIAGFVMFVSLAEQLLRNKNIE
jgi:hypothetical protein